MYIFAIARRTSDGNAGMSQGIAMENEGYQPGDGIPGKRDVETQGVDDVDLSLSAHSEKTKYDVERAQKNSSSGKRSKASGSVPSYWFIFMVVLLAVGFFLALGLGLAFGHPDPKLDPYQFTNGAVASDHKLCSKVGRDLLKNGGNALDAAIGTAFCVGVLNYHVGGVGGGGFLTFYNKSAVGVKDAVITAAIDGQVVAPSMATKDMFNGNNDAATSGGMSIAIPGAVAGLYKAHRTLGGTLSWATLLEPSIRLAEGGFKIGEALANAIKQNDQEIKNDTGLSEIFVANGDIKKRGDKVKLPKLAETLETIATLGAEGFYEGDLAMKIVEDVNAAGGNITMEDLKNYKALTAKTLSVELGGGKLYASGGIKVYAPPPPSSGVLANYILNILEGYDLYWGSVDTTEETVQTYHRMLEAFKFTLAERSRLGDPNFEDSVQAVVTNLGLTSTATSTRDAIQEKALDFAEYGSKYAPMMDAAGGATHISVKDATGNAVSYTSCLSQDFGAKTRGSRTGILFNAGMADFTLPDSGQVEGLDPSPVNFIEPGKRPLSSMSPLILVDKDGEVKAVIGSSGGLEMITSTAMMAVQTIWFEDNVIDAMKRARFSTDLMVESSSKKVTYYHEDDFETAVVNGLASRNQSVDDSSSLTSSVNYIMQTKKNRWYTNADTRTPGSGYALY